MGGGGSLPKKRLNIVRMPRRFRLVPGVGLVGSACAKLAAAGDFVSATWPVKTQSDVTLASRIRVTNCGFGSIGGFGLAAENASGGMTTLTGGSSCGAVGAAPVVRVTTGLVSFACAGIVKPGSASGAVPFICLAAGADAALFAGGVDAGGGTGGGGGSSASTVGITEVPRGRVSEIAGGGC